MTRFQVIRPNFSSVLDPTVDFFAILDHMPHVEFSHGQSLDNTKIKYFGKNTIRDRFIDQGLNFQDYFFIFDTYLNLEDFKINSYFYPNWLLHTAINYQLFSSDCTIDFTKKTHSVNCVMNKQRSARVLASCWFANNKVDRVLHTQSWTNTDHAILNHLNRLLPLGGLSAPPMGPDVRLLDQQWIDSEMFALNQEKSKISIAPCYNNMVNFFNSAVRQVFDTTAISVVLEPVFWEHGSIASEKYMHAIYGGTIPLVSGYKIYDSLATLGFDTFQDIIDISSQYELDPILRVWNMLEKNKKLFLQWQELISDKQIQKRIINNLTLLRNPEQIFMNSLKLNSKQSLAKIVTVKNGLNSLGFHYLKQLLDEIKTS